MAFILLFNPLEDFHSEEGAIILLSILIFVILITRRIKANVFFNNRWISLWTIPFIIFSLYEIFSNDWNKEIIYVYNTLFSTLESGLNPYTSNVIYHRLEDGSVVYSTFNYLPGEIFLYYLAYLISNSWNFAIMLISNLFINLIVVGIFIIKTPKMNRTTKILYSLILTLTAIIHSVSTVFFLIMVSGFILLNNKEEIKLKQRILLTVLMGFGSVCKFFMLPFIFIYFWSNIIEKRKYSYILDSLGVTSVFLLFTIPFGVWNVLQSSIFFNLNLTQRAEVTTYYFNIVSGLCYIFNLKILYAPVVIISFIIFVVISKNIPFHRRVLYISALSLILFPTPEDQFLGCIFGYLILTKLYELQVPSSEPKSVKKIKVYQSKPMEEPITFPRPFTSYEKFVVDSSHLENLNILCNADLIRKCK